MELISVEDELPPFDHYVLVRAYRDTWMDGVDWVSACRIDFCPDDEWEWMWDPSNFDMYAPDEVDYWCEIPLVGDEADYVSTD